MRRRWKPEINTNHEFDLDLAPLLAVMVKLVPVLLISSAFVQVMMVETDLPQAVKEAIKKQDDPKLDRANIYVEVSRKNGIKVTVQKSGQQKVETLKPLAEGKLDFPGLYQSLLKIKTENPEVFRLSLSPSGDISYQEITKIMDTARQSKDKQIKFSVFDSKENKEVQTNFMFPDVVFSNVMEG